MSAGQSGADTGRCSTVLWALAGSARRLLGWDALHPARDAARHPNLLPAIIAAVDPGDTHAGRTGMVRALEVEGFPSAATARRSSGVHRSNSAWFDAFASADQRRGRWC